MRALATRGDLYGPNAGLTFSETALNAQASDAGVQSTPQPVPVTHVLGNLRNTIVAKPIASLVLLILILVAYKLVEEHRGGREAFEEMKLGLNNVVKVGLVAMLFFAIAKFLAIRYQVPGVSDFVQFATGG